MKKGRGEQEETEKHLLLCIMLNFRTHNLKPVITQRHGSNIRGDHQGCISYMSLRGRKALLTNEIMKT